METTLPRSTSENSFSTRVHSSASRDGQYLTLLLGEEEYGIRIHNVHEIISLMPISPLPGAQSSILGVINLRGRVIPVLGLRRRFGMPDEARTMHTCIVVVQVDGVEAGLLVDRVLEVCHIDEEAVGDPPFMGEGVDSSLLLGIARSGGKIRLLLDLRPILDLTAPGSAVSTH